MKIYDDYQAFTKSVAVYPDFLPPAQLGFPVYLPLGICDEAGELMEKIVGFTSAMTLSGGKPYKAGILKEAGDVLWYCTRFIDEHGNRLSDYMTPRYDGVATLDGLACYVCIHAGVIAGRTKKRIRDGSQMTDLEFSENTNLQMIAVHRIISALQLIARFFSTTIEQVMNDNQHKLLDRKDRGVLRGNGDNR